MTLQGGRTDEGPGGARRRGSRRVLKALLPECVGACLTVRARPCPDAARLSLRGAGVTEAADFSSSCSRAPHEAGQSFAGPAYPSSSVQSCFLPLPFAGVDTMSTFSYPTLSRSICFWRNHSATLKLVRRWDSRLHHSLTSSEVGG